MILDVESGVAFLIEHGLIDVEWIIDGDLSVRAVYRLNSNLRVDAPGGLGYLIKQPEPGCGGDARLAREASFLRDCHRAESGGALSELTPTLVLASEEPRAYVYALLPGFDSLWAYIESRRGNVRDQDLGQAIGFTLGRAHNALSCETGSADRALPLPSDPPWALCVDRPRPAMIAGMSAGQFEIHRIVQSCEGMVAHLDRARRLWRSDSVIHGDVKLDNIVIRSSRSDDGSDHLELRIVDWEMVSWGDRAWDLAGALQDFLVLWVCSMPLLERLDADRMFAEATLPLDFVRKCTCALWDAYRDEVDLAAAGAESFLDRAVTYSAVRLIQSAYEMSHAMDQPPIRAIVILQVAANLLAEPDRGRVQLFGIPWRPAVL